MRLGLSTLDLLPASVARPDYDRESIESGIVHLGIGAFHRGHQAVMTDRLLARDPRWGIVGVSLRTPETREALFPQDGLYTVSAVDGSGADRRVIGAHTGFMVTPEDPTAIPERLASPHVRIVSSTVTEKGYSHDPATGALNEDDPDIRHDLVHLDRPHSTIGTLVSGLKLRREAGMKPFTVLACDNLPANGRTLRGLVLRFAEMVDRDLSSWIRDEVRFPSTMVDRIVPATTDADRAAVAAAIGMEDAWPIVTEPFIQWVIEDEFTQERPAWEDVGAEFVTDVAPYELMKLRLLNGTHSTLSYLGYLMGRATVAEAMEEPGIARLVEEMMFQEIGPTLPALPGFDLDGYRRSLLARYRNPALRHRTWQIAMDGSQKLPQRLLGTIRDRLKIGAPIDRLALGVAAWMRYVTGRDETGAPIDVRDPLAARLGTIAAAAGPVASRLAPALLAVREIFGDDLPADPRFTSAVERALERIYAHCARGAVERTLAEARP